MSTALGWAAKVATSALAVLVLVLVPVLVGPPYWAELLLTAVVVAAGARAWSWIDRTEPRAAQPRAADRQ
ncbi:hypothetical protein OG594_21815 [Streptomyces sp. NBC_01214]|uniref:hypothetical protein n=1 Tax=Streptomyces sp. NBC_01214 TaxID=2903777 RepID=UPI0022556DC5|nr:hypothetical protein [Streptomyces sp. NBC_01214]MCX4804246.1 hypothetical protein [Streptomyces sp. NBC_01214]